MTRHHPLPALLVALAAAACMPPRQGNQPAAEQPLVSAEQKEAVRQQEAQADELEKQMGNLEETQIQGYETDLEKALKFALGKEALSPGAPPPESSSTVVKGLGEAKIKVRLEPVVDDKGHPVSDNFLQLKDSYTDRVQQLSRKISEQKATKAEMKEVQDGAKHVMKLNDLRMQVMKLSLVTMQSNSMVQSSSMTTMLRVAGLVRTRKLMEMEMNADDYARVKRWLERQRRIEAIAATSLALLAAYQGVLNDNGDPEALDLLSSKVLEAYPPKPSVSDAEAKDYVKNLKGNVSKAKSQYEAMMRKLHGDSRYEAQYKAGIDAMFKQAEDAEGQKSVTQMAADTQAKYNEDIARCARGEAISPGSLVSPPRCKQVREASLRGEPIPQSLESSVEQAAPSGGADSIFGMLPGFNIIKASIEGVQALAKGDAKGALNAAIGLVPGGGPLRDTIAQVSNMMSAPTPRAKKT
jgi:hypothetical protein